MNKDNEEYWDKEKVLIPIKDICLDPDNPRLDTYLRTLEREGLEVEKLNQDDLLKHYLNVEKEAFEQWKQSIQINGVINPIFVIHAPKDYPCKYVVKEGNVRLAILKHLTKEQAKGNAKPPDGVQWDVIPAICLHIFDYNLKELL